jgi:hypothetical protein
LDNWTFELGYGCPNLCNRGNNKRQVYTETNHGLENGYTLNKDYQKRETGI